MSENFKVFRLIDSWFVRGFIIVCLDVSSLFC